MFRGYIVMLSDANDNTTWGIILDKINKIGFNLLSIFDRITFLAKTMTLQLPERLLLSSSGSASMMHVSET